MMSKKVGRNEPQELNEEVKKFFGLLNEAKQLLFAGCNKYSNQAFLVKLIHLKCINHWSNSFFNELLKLLKDAFPICEKLTTSNYKAKRIVKDLGLYYEKIDVCKNDCMIYYKEEAEATQFQVYGLSRWKSITKGGKGEKIF